jgi:hypothetical protein
MAETPEGGGMSHHSFQVAYDGGQAAGHSMDVEMLAPALLAFGRLIRESNALLNQDRATVKVLVASDFEHKCFNINFEVIQTILQKMQSLLQDDNVKTAIDILQKIGVVGSAVGTLLGFLKWKKGRPAKGVQEIRDSTASGSVILQVHVDGEHNTFNLSPDVFKLAESPKVLDAVRGALEPVETGGVDKIEFRQNDQPMSVLDKEATQSIIRSCDFGPDPIAIAEDKPKPKIVTATLYTHGPVFDPKAPNWRFKYRNKPIFADVSETTIAADAFRRGSSNKNDRYRVRMEVTESDKEEGAPHYKILEVIDFTPAEEQSSFLLKKPRRTRQRRGE